MCRGRSTASRWSRDGKAVTLLTLSYESDLAAGFGPDSQAKCGSLKYGCELMINLNGPKPVVTDVKLAQSFAV